jgi:hypothetical protein
MPLAHPKAKLDDLVDCYNDEPSHQRYAIRQSDPTWARPVMLPNLASLPAVAVQLLPRLARDCDIRYFVNSKSFL